MFPPLTWWHFSHHAGAWWILSKRLAAPCAARPASNSAMCLGESPLRGCRPRAGRRRRPRQPFFLNRCGPWRVAPLVMFEPFRQRGLEPFAAPWVAGQPDRLEHGQQHGGIIDDFGAGSWAPRAAQRTRQPPPGGCARGTAIEAKLVEAAALVRTTGTLITAVALGEILAVG